jgi:hypothetical protein
VLFYKKITARGINREEDKPIDFSWIIFIGMNKLGFTYKQVRKMYFGFWVELFENYKKQHNFEMKRALYSLHEEDEEISSLSVL